MNMRYAIVALLFGLLPSVVAAQTTVWQIFGESWPWYVTRASGIIAFVLFLILMLSGIGFISGHSFKFLEPITAWATHKALGIAMGIAVVVHVGSLYFDTYVNFDLKGLLVPFVSDYGTIDLFGFHVGSLFLAFGILAFYIILSTVITSIMWIHKKPQTWKTIHLLNYVAALLIFFHALYLGTDFSGGIARTIFITLGILIVIATMVRLWRAKTV